jgi:hypothetical protein
MNGAKDSPFDKLRANGTVLIFEGIRRAQLHRAPLSMNGNKYFALRQAQCERYNSYFQENIMINCQPSTLDNGLIEHDN